MQYVINTMAAKPPVQRSLPIHRLTAGCLHDSNLLPVDGCT